MSNEQDKAQPNQRGNDSDLTALLCTAKKVDMPDWATHVAVSKVRKDDAEPCYWHEKANDYIDENPENLKDHVWTGSYKHRYWHFFTREEVCA